MSNVDGQATVVLEQLAAQGLAEALRRLADLLEQEVRRLTPVDVPCRHLCLGDVVLCNREFGAVVGETAYPRQCSGLRAIEHHNLSAARRLLSVRCSLTIETSSVIDSG